MCGHERKLSAPSLWLRAVKADHASCERAEHRHIGLLGFIGDWATIPARHLTGASGLQEAIEEHCDRPARDLAFVAPATHLPGVHFRGDPVQSIIAVLPKAVASCCLLFLDARAFAMPVTALILPFAITSLEHVFRLAGGCFPEHVPLKADGIAPIDYISGRFYPVHKAVLRVYPAEEDATPHCIGLSTVSDSAGYDGLDQPEPSPHSAALGLHGPPPATGRLVGGARRLLASSDMSAAVAATTPIVDLTDLAFVFEQPPAIPALRTDVDEPTSPNDAGPPEGEESETEGAASRSTMNTWRVPVKLMRFQQDGVFHVLWVAEGESQEDLLTRARILLGPTELTHDVFFPDPQPTDRWLTVLCAPSWWRSKDMCVTLVSPLDLDQHDFVAIYEAGVTVPSLLPEAVLPSQRRVDVYNSGGDVAPGEDIPAGSIFVLQPAGRTVPARPSPGDVFANPALDCREDQLPAAEAIPATRYLLLGEDFSQTVLDLAYGPVTPQVAGVTGLPAPSVSIWFHKGSSHAFGRISVKGQVVEKYLGYRPFRVGSDGPSLLVFIDARALGKPVCCRLFSRGVFRAEDFLDALDIELSSRFTVRFSGREAHPVGGDPLVRRVAHCSSVILQVASVEPGSPLTTHELDSDEAPTADEGEDDSDEDHGCARRFGNPGSAVMRGGQRSRSPRRNPSGSRHVRDAGTWPRSSGLSGLIRGQPAKQLHVRGRLCLRRRLLAIPCGRSVHLQMHYLSATLWTPLVIAAVFRLPPPPGTS